MKEYGDISHSRLVAVNYPRLLDELCELTGCRCFSGSEMEMYRECKDSPTELRSFVTKIIEERKERKTSEEVEWERIKGIVPTESNDNLETVFYYSKPGNFKQCLMFL